jgi:putative membrane protein
MARASEVFGTEGRRVVEEAIADVESRTSAEIVVVAATRSGRYDRAEDLFGLAVAMVVCFVVWFAAIAFGEGDTQWQGAWAQVWPAIGLGLLFVGVFAAATFAAGRLFPLARPFLTRKEMLDEVKSSAAEAFLHCRVGRTASGTGMLVYVSLVERMVWIVGDDAVNDKVDSAVWSMARDQVVAGFHEGRPAEKLAEAFPIADDDVNELKNELVILD